jgi:hypothetical protein
MCGSSTEDGRPGWAAVMSELCASCGPPFGIAHHLVIAPPPAGSMEPVTSATTVPARVAAAPALLVAAIVLLAINMRGPIVAVAPVAEAIRADLGVDGGTVGLLTSLPVLCFGLATPPASALLARLGLGGACSSRSPCCWRGSWCARSAACPRRSREPC